MTVVTVEMNPITTGDNLPHGDNIILGGATAADAAQVPIFAITKISPDLGWTDDDTRLAW